MSPSNVASSFSNVVKNSGQASARSVELAPDQMGHNASRAWVLEAAGELEEAWELVQRIVEDGRSIPLPSGSIESSMHGFGFHEFPLVEVDHARCRRSAVGVVGDHDDGLGKILVELLQKRKHIAGAGGVEVAGGFIGQNNIRIGHWAFLSTPGIGGLHRRAILQ